jgi:radical SAM peptide maturase (CXXX-repeat target family)
MSIDVAKQFIDMILDADDRTNTYITSDNCDGAVINFVGGEPWLEIDLISQISDYFIGELFRRKHPWAIKFMLNVCSNGMLHFDERVQNYMKKHSKHFNYNISIDGNQELHDACRIDLNGNGTYERAIAGVNNYRDVFGGEMGSKMTIAPGNVDKVFSAVSYMIKENGYRNINLNCVYEEGWTNEHANTLYLELNKLTDWLIENNLQDDVYLSIFDKNCGEPLPENDNRNWCGGVGFMLAVDYKGDIYPCLRYMESSVGDKVPAYVIGNIHDGINKKPEHCERIDCFKCITRQSQSTEECYHCPIAKGCSWCSAYNYECFGTPNKRATFICCMHKARVLANIYHWRRKGVDFAMHCPEDWAIEIIGKTEFEKLNALKVGGK